MCPVFGGRPQIGVHESNSIRFPAHQNTVKIEVHTNRVVNLLFIGTFLVHHVSRAHLQPIEGRCMNYAGSIGPHIVIKIYSYRMLSLVVKCLNSEFEILHAFGIEGVIEMQMQKHCSRPQRLNVMYQYR